MNVRQNSSFDFQVCPLSSHEGRSCRVRCESNLRWGQLKFHKLTTGLQRYSLHRWPVQTVCVRAEELTHRWRAMVLMFCQRTRNILSRGNPAFIKRSFCLFHSAATLEPDKRGTTCWTAAAVTLELYLHARLPWCCCDHLNLQSWRWGQLILASHWCGWEKFKLQVWRINREGSMILLVPVTVRVVPGKTLSQIVNLKWYSAESLFLRSVILRVERPAPVSRTWIWPWESTAEELIHCCPPLNQSLEPIQL